MPSSLFGPQAQPQQQSVPQPLATNTPQISANANQIRTLWNMLNSGGNPQAMIQSLLANNPQMKTIMDLANKYGGNYQAAFMDLAKQKNCDPVQFLSQLKQSIGMG